jgi:uncharacterized Zn finger protein
MAWGRSGRSYDRYSSWAPYVSVAERRAKAARYAQSLEKKRGTKLAPITIEGRQIARSFWGKAWCDNLEAYSDFSNRLPRGRTYVRNGSVIDLQIEPGIITALVSGSEIYELTISIATLPEKTWKAIRSDCARSIGSLIDLLQGRFDKGIMERLTRPVDGLFPKPAEVKMQCSCPDYAGMCKHVAAVLYGVGARLDHAPELLFTLRKVNHLDLIDQAVSSENLDRAFAGGSEDVLDAGDLGELFGIELESPISPPTEASVKRSREAKSKQASALTAARVVAKKKAASETRGAATTKSVKKSAVSKKKVVAIAKPKPFPIEKARAVAKKLAKKAVKKKAATRKLVDTTSKATVRARRVR